MKLPMLIDGRSVFRRFASAADPAHDARTRLLRRIRAIAPLGATVFLCGRPGGEEAARADDAGGTETGGLTIRYSGETAPGTSILHHLLTAKHPGRCTVVTDDLELARHAERIGASSMRVVQFFDDTPDLPSPREPLPFGLRAADFGLEEGLCPDGTCPPGACGRNVTAVSADGSRLRATAGESACLPAGSLPVPGPQILHDAEQASGPVPQPGI